MFTGIIEEIGTVQSFNLHQNNAELTVECSKILKDTKLGDSISVNGVCQTVVKKSANSFTAEVSDETLKVTNFFQIKSGDKVNLERAMTLTERMGGHVVQGHVDNIAKLISITQKNNFYNMKFELKPELSKHVIKKGSIAINGISLTVADIQENTITIAVIPHTFENTNLSMLSIGQNVNIETDIFAKYVEKILFNNKAKSTISEDFLKENGFL